MGISADVLDKGEEEEKAWDDIFFGIKQINVHAKEDVHKGIDFLHRCRRW